jgi:hypothetical protein
MLITILKLIIADIKCWVGKLLMEYIADSAFQGGSRHRVRLANQGIVLEE